MGTIIKVSSADFSNSPFGKVTTTDTLIDNIVSVYTTAIGDTSHQTELRTLVKSLYDNGLWEGLDIYPMIGNTLAKKCVNLNPTNGTLKTDIVVPDNAASVDDYISFSQDVASGDKTETYIAGVAMNNFYVAAEMQRVATSPNASPLYSAWAGYPCNLGGKANIGTGKTTFSVNSAQTELGVENTSRKFISGSLYQSDADSVGTLDVYADAVKVGDLQTSYNFKLTSSYNPGVTGRIGGKNNSSTTSELFDGNCWFFAIGFVDHSKRELLDTIIKTFLDAVKPRA